MSYPVLIILICAASLIAFLSGYKCGLRRGISVAKNNTHNLMQQLKSANTFASELRDEDKAVREADQIEREIN